MNLNPSLSLKEELASEFKKLTSSTFESTSTRTLSNMENTQEGESKFLEGYNRGLI